MLPTGVSQRRRLGRVPDSMRTTRLRRALAAVTAAAVLASMSAATTLDHGPMEVFSNSPSTIRR